MRRSSRHTTLVDDPLDDDRANCSHIQPQCTNEYSIAAVACVSRHEAAAASPPVVLPRSVTNLSGCAGYGPHLGFRHALANRSGSAKNS